MTVASIPSSVALGMFLEVTKAGLSSGLKDSGFSALPLAHKLHSSLPVDSSQCPWRAHPDLRPPERPVHSLPWPTRFPGCLLYQGPGTCFLPYSQGFSTALASVHLFLKSTAARPTGIPADRLCRPYSCSDLSCALFPASCFCSIRVS